jgi:hypothetical protein
MFSLPTYYYLFLSKKTNFEHKLLLPFAMTRLIAYGQFISALSSALCQYLTTIGIRHSLSEAVLVSALRSTGLECSFHCFLLWAAKV